MFLKLGNLSANAFNNNNFSDAFIISGIINSLTSPESPKIIKSADELEFYYGNEFEEFNYYRQLLNSGILLLLFKPIKFNRLLKDYVTEVVDYILPDNPKEGIRYYLEFEQKYYYWILGDWYTEEMLPENIFNLTLSLDYNNRDNLILTKDCAISLSTIVSSNKDYLNKDLIRKNLISGNPFSIDVLFETLDFFRSYFVIQIYKEDLKSQFIFIGLNDNNEELKDKFLSLKIPGQFISINGNNLNTIIYLLNSKLKLIDSSFLVIKLNESLINISSNNPLIVNNSFTNIKNIIIKKNQKINSDIIDWALLPDESTEENFEYYQIIDNRKQYIQKFYKVLEITSKILGPQDNNPIKFSIDYINNYILISIKKGNYSETFLDKSFKNLCKQINISSLLVTCKRFVYYDKNDNELDLIPSSGTWILSGALEMDYTSIDYWNGLKAILEINVLEDFLLIPNISLWIYKNSSEFNYYLEYLDFLEYSLEKHCLILFNINKDLILHNYILDSSSSLLYFYNLNIQVECQFFRPSYYYFLNGIFFNRWNIENSDLIEINSDLNEDFLLNYKCSFISSYDNGYFYKKFNEKLNDNDVSGILRFVLSRITRLIYRFKWSLLGNSKQDRKLFLENLFDLVRNQNYRLIKNIYISDFILNKDKQSIDLVLKIEINEFVEKDIMLNITINYLN